jgi:hypothetical protein
MQRERQLGAVAQFFAARTLGCFGDCKIIAVSSIFSDRGRFALESAVARKY